MSPRVVSTAVLILLLACSLASGNWRHPTRIKPPCCVELTTANISSQVKGNTYRTPSDKKPCVRAVILETTSGSVCADPKTPWVKHLIANMRAV